MYRFSSEDRDDLFTHLGLSEVLTSSNAGVRGACKPLNSSSCLGAGLAGSCGAWTERYMKKGFSDPSWRRTKSWASPDRTSSWKLSSGYLVGFPLWLSTLSPTAAYHSSHPGG